MPTRQSSGLAGLPPKPGANVQASPRTRRNSTRTGAASGSQAAGIAGNESGEGGELTVENFGPPAWRTVLNLRADLGEYTRDARGGAHAYEKDGPTSTRPDRASINRRMS